MKHRVIQRKRLIVQRSTVTLQNLIMGLIFITISYIPNIDDQMGQYSGCYCKTYARQISPFSVLGSPSLLFLAIFKNALSLGHQNRSQHRCTQLF